MNPKKIRIKIGIAWYRKEQWKFLKSSCDDSDNLENTYEEWLQNAKKIELDLAVKGYDPERIDINIELLNKWCKRNKKPNTTATRSEYVTILLKEKIV